MPTARHAAPTAGGSPPWLSAVCLPRAPPPPRTAPRGWEGLGSRITSPVVLPEELLAVVGRVRLLHLRDPGPGPLPLEGWGEEGRAVVPLGGGGCAEGGHLGTRRVSPGWPGDLIGGPVPTHLPPAVRGRPGARRALATSSTPGRALLPSWGLNRRAGVIGAQSKPGC